jgi:hypothetical protein
MNLERKTAGLDANAEKHPARERALAGMRDLVEYDRAHAYVSPDKFVQLRTEAVQTGQVSKDEVNQLPEVLAAAKRSILSQLRTVNGYSRVDDFLEARTGWNEAGVFTAEEINNFGRSKRGGEDGYY